MDVSTKKSSKYLSQSQWELIFVTCVASVVVVMNTLDLLLLLLYYIIVYIIQLLISSVLLRAITRLQSCCIGNRNC